MTVYRLRQSHMTIQRPLSGDPATVPRLSRLSPSRIDVQLRAGLFLQVLRFWIIALPMFPIHVSSPHGQYAV